MTTHPEVLELLALSEKATPGPWELADHDDYGDFDGNSRVILGDDRRIGVIQVKSVVDAEDNANAELSVALVNWFRTRAESLTTPPPRASVSGVDDGVRYKLNADGTLTPLIADGDVKDAARYRCFRAAVIANEGAAYEIFKANDRPESEDEMDDLCDTALQQAADGVTPAERIGD